MDKIEIENILDEIGVPLNLRGYKYVIEAVMQINKNPFKLMGEIYSDIAKKFNTSTTRVERAIRHTYENNKNDIVKYFNLKCKLNNGIFVTAIERKIRRNKENLNKLQQG